MGGYVGMAPACYGSSLDFEFRHLSNIQIGRHKQRTGQHTQARQKNIGTKKALDPHSNRSTD
jgi:hypothetical protein